MTRLLACLTLLFCALFARAEDAAIGEVFTATGARGTLVIEALGSRQRFVHDQRRARQAYAAASTFKVLHSLIALEEQAIGDEHEVIAWDGKQHEIADWNQDQTLASAFRVSCVWCYQELARRIGASRYPQHIRAAGFGQLSDGFAARTFWLDGALTISAEQQIVFLRRLVERRLPYRASSFAILRTIMLAESGPTHRLYAKTGWATRSTPGIGWYVGYLENAGETWLFALNLDIQDAAELPLRRQIMLAALRAKGILPTP
ncbi:MAG: class D beta-lactamase [Dechloromonas sp.]|nr:MAG: class D beta-lactamase [Dechloromonas sp.]